MTAKNILTTCVFCFALLSITFAQNVNNFQRLKARGNLPKEFTSSSKSKYEALEKKADSKKKVARKEKKFYLESSFAIDQMLKSGVVLYGDPVTEYINKVADNLLKNDPKLRKKLRFYTVKSSEVNAFATDRGSIFINLGLISKLETEAQIAFILAHEIIHYQEKHSMDSFLEYQEIDDLYKRNKTYDQLLKKSNYSQKLEEEADEEGMEIFDKSDYGSSSLPQLYEIMATSHVAYSDVEFDKSYLEINEMVLPDSLLSDTIAEIEKYMEDEELSTHPSLKDRKAKMEKRFGSTSSGKSDFLLPQEDFEKIRTLSRFEICNILLHNQSFPAALYYSYALSKEFSENKFLQGVKVKALYGMAQYANSSQREAIPVDPEPVQGNMQQAFHILNKMKAKELSAVAAAHLWEHHRKNIKDEAMRLRTKDMIVDLMKFHIDDKDEFFTKKPTGDESYTKGIFAEEYKNSDFQKYVKEGGKARRKYKKMEHRLEYLETFTKGYGKKKKKELKNGVGLKKKKMIFINPMYYRINKKKKVPMRYIESETRQGDFVKLIKKTSKKLNFKSEILDVNSLKKNSIEEDFNEIAAINFWMDELGEHGVEMLPSNHGDVMKITEKYGVDAITYTGVLSVRNRSSIAALIYSYLIPSGYFAPMAYHSPLLNNNDTVFFWMTIDTENLEVLHSEINAMKMKTADLVLESNIYWMIDQMKRSR